MLSSALSCKPSRSLGKGSMAVAPRPPLVPSPKSGRRHLQKQRPARASAEVRCQGQPRSWGAPGRGSQPHRLIASAFKPLAQPRAPRNAHSVPSRDPSFDDGSSHGTRGGRPAPDAAPAPSPPPAQPEGTTALGSPVPLRMNTIPHSREMRKHFYEAAAAGVARAVAGGEKLAMKIRLTVPETNPEMDVYRVGTLLEMVRSIATRLCQDGKRVKVCVQVSRARAPPPRPPPRPREASPGAPHRLQTSVKYTGVGGGLWRGQACVPGSRLPPRRVHFTGI